MTIKTLKALALAATATFAAGAASAATVNYTLNPAGEAYVSSEDVVAGDTLVYTFTATGSDMRINDFLAAVGLGTQSGDIAAMRVGINGALQPFQTTSLGGLLGASTFSGFFLKMNDDFTFTFNNSNGAAKVGTNLQFTTAPVPVPAAGLLLLTALAGAAAFGRRKKSA